MHSPSVPAVRRTAVLLGAAVLGLLPACSDDTPPEVIDAQQDAATGDAIAAGPASAAEARRVGATVIDVRTPEEFEAGHVTDAELIDIQGPDFATRIGELDAATTYVVYCRSGNRSAAAASQMRDAGLTVLDGGGLDDMAGAGWPTTTP